MIKLVFANVVVFLFLLLSTGCEPDPKMIGYGNNDDGQLEFPGTNWNHQPLIEGYRKAWSGGNFSIAGAGSGPWGGLFCKGDSSLGQCDVPEEFYVGDFVGFNGPGIPRGKISLGYDHAMAVLPDTVSLLNFNNGEKIYLWGDNSYGQLDIPELPDTVRVFDIATGNNHNIIFVGDIVLQQTDSASVYVVQNNRLVAWGDNSYGQCDIPAKFNPVSDSLSIISIKAGANHTVIMYDSSGITKMSAWGDNSYGQSEILSIEELNGNNVLLDVYCGYNHNVAITYNTEIDYYQDLMAGYDIDELVSIFPYSPSASYDSYSGAYSVTIHAWGDNSFGQTDVPDLAGIFEGFEAGGYHNNIIVSDNLITNYGQGYSNTIEPFTVPQTREIIGWGKNDYGQTEFPAAYVFDAFDNIPDPNAVLINSPPVISSGENHNLVIGAQLWRAPSMNYNNLNQFNGALGDTIYQTLTLENIGPDTLFIDSLDLFRPYTGQTNHPFYIDEPEEDYILFGDSISYVIYCVFDSAHAYIYENANIYFYVRGWFEETYNIPLNSYFGPLVNIQIDRNFHGVSNETVSRPLKIRNDGNATVFIDSMAIRNGGPFYIEPLGDENLIEPGDSVQISIYTTLLDTPRAYFDYLDLYLTNFNTQMITAGRLNASRYLKLGDNISSYDQYIQFCSQTENTGLSNFFNLAQIAELNNKIHYFDFGYHKSEHDSVYIQNLNIFFEEYRDNSNIFSMIHAIPANTDEQWMNPIGFPMLIDSCYQFLDDHFLYQDNVGAIRLDSLYFNNLFEPHVESVIFNDIGEITFIDTFNLDLLSASVDTAISDCGIDCLGGNVLTLGSDTSMVSMDMGTTLVDSFAIDNTTDFDLNYNLSYQSGTEIIKSAIFHSEDDDLVADVGLLGSPATISIWFKPLSSAWSVNGSGYTNFISPIGIDSSESWKIILESNTAFARIGWHKQDSLIIISQSPVWHANDTWYHCVFIYNAEDQSINLYKNGLWEATSAYGDPINLGEKIGINVNGPGYFNGMLSQTAFWNTTLTPAEIVYLHESGPNFNLSNDYGEYVSSTDLMLFWGFNESSGSVVEDLSGNNYHANLGGYIAERWNTSVLPTENRWLFPLANNAGAGAAANTSHSSFFRVDAANLSAGTYYGTITLDPWLVAISQSQKFIKLVISENLTLSSEVIPLSYSLHQNFPNPFNPKTKIKYDLPKGEFVAINIFDLTGRNVRALENKNQKAGQHTVSWDAKNNSGQPVSAGMYIYTIEAGEFRQSRKMVLLK